MRLARTPPPHAFGWFEALYSGSLLSAARPSG